MSSILITGCGFFTKHFVRQLLSSQEGQQHPHVFDRICIYSRDEWKHAQLRMALNDHPFLRWFVGDVRDLARLKRAMRGVNYVVHGAALKRIETGAYNPDEMVKTNIVGTMNVIEACLESGVIHATLLSTDKAYQPVSPYGQSKALAESLFIASNDVGGEGGTKFAVTRYGNVAGSTGSVIPIWREMRHRGEQVRITDPDATRFWMTPLEAVSMVLTAIKRQQTGLILPGPLPAFKLFDLATAMNSILAKIEGLPPWEKLHENLSAEMCSKDARRMSVEELREELKHVE